MDDAGKLIGSWVIDPADYRSKEIYGDVSITFNKDGKMTYVIYENGKQQGIFLTYKLDANNLITNQPTNPQEEVTKFRLNDDDSLSLFFNNQEGRFVRPT